MTTKLMGTGVALVTPFDAELQIDFQGLERLLQHIAESQVRYLVVHGTTGEAATTTPAEKKAILQFIQAHNPRKLPIVYGIGGSNTSAVLEALQHTDLQEVEAVLSVTPYYNRPSQAGLYQHYTTLADASPVPLLLYNVPARTGVNLAAATTLQLSAHPNIVGIKEASGDLVQCLEIAQGKSADFSLIAGDDLLTLPMMALGAAGLVATVANAYPQAMSQLVEVALQNDFTAARRHAKALLPPCKFISATGNPVGTKQLLATLGICQHHVRLPLVPSSAPPPTVAIQTD
ncbi:MAG: 4-hydroxy-tetrahydrodipicolinate synthase [Bacteroidota bacterium]